MLLNVDVVIFTIHEQSLCLLMVDDALPNSAIEQKDNTLEEIAQRKVKTLTGIEMPYVEQVETVGNKHLGIWSIAIVYYSLVPYTPLSLGKWVKVEAVMPQAMIQSALQRFQNKSLYTSLPIFLLPSEFTLTELQKTYEVVLGFTIEKKSFRRRLLDAGFLTETGNIRRANHRPAHLYRLLQKKPYYFPRILEGARV